MSLIGSLEDLGLGDILQIISLSRKSGVLSIRGEDGEGSILLCEGLVRSANLKGGPEDLRGVLVGGRFLEDPEFDEACELARRDGVTVEEALAAHTSLTAERIDSLRRECVEAAVIAMFAWRTGEFSFDVRTDVAADDPSLFLPMGINAQYLAMEGTRIEDESAHIRAGFREEAGAEMTDELSDLSAEEMFGVDPADVLSMGPGVGEAVETERDPDEDTPTVESVAGAPLASPVEALGLAIAERIDDPSEHEPDLAAALVVPEDKGDPDEGFAFAKAAAHGTAPVIESDEPRKHSQVPSMPPQPLAAEEPAQPPSKPSLEILPSAPLVVIDPDLVALEWIKETLQDFFPRIHIFQRWDLGLNPIRQYLARASRPVVLMRPDAAGDPLSGIRNGHDFVARLKSQHSRLPVLLLGDPEAAPVMQVAPADGVLTRPSSLQLRSPRAAAELQALASQFREELATVLAKDVEAVGDLAPGQSRKSDPLHRLKQVTEALAEASTRGDVLPMVIRFASEIFDRVAMFMVRGDAVAGMAQHGLPSAGGPDDAGLRQIELSSLGCSWFRTILETRRPVRSGPTEAGDYTLSALLGSAAPTEVYLAPIESGGEIVALLYGDNLKSHRPLGDTEALEVVLQHAGLAIERAVLERALAEAQSAPAD